MAYFKPRRWVERSLDFTVVLTSKTPFKSINISEKSVNYALTVSGVGKENWKDHRVGNSSYATQDIVLCNGVNNDDFIDGTNPTWWALDKVDVNLPECKSDNDSFLYTWSVCLADGDGKNRKSAIPSSATKHNKTILWEEYALKNITTHGRTMNVIAIDATQHIRQGELSNTSNQGSIVINNDNKVKSKNISMFIGSPLHSLLEQKAYSIKLSDFTRFGKCTEDGEDKVLIYGDEVYSQEDDLQFLLIDAITDNVVKYCLNKSFDCELLEENTKTNELDYPTRHDANGDCVSMVIPFKAIQLFVTWMETLGQDSGVNDIRNKQLLLVINRHYDYNMSRPRQIKVRLTYRVAKNESKYKDATHILSSITLPNSVFCASKSNNDEDDNNEDSLDDIYLSDTQLEGDDRACANVTDDEDSDSGLPRW